ncbi:MAG: FAD-dependent oxidoreductase [Candidatus Dormiibacterota bacterium]
MRERYPGYARGRQSARTQLTANLRRLFALNALADARRLPVDAVLEELEQRTVLNRPVSRRRFLGGAALAGAGVAFGPAATRVLASARSTSTGQMPRIAVVGAGLAGLRCSHLLWTRHRIRSNLYEGHAERIGGRCWTLRDYFSNGLITEHGGAFIDSNQYAALDLAAELGLQLEDYNGGELQGLPEVYWFDGAYYTYAEASNDWRAFGYKAFHDAVTESNTEPGLARLDGLSAPEWLDETPIGSASRFGRLMLANTVSENGGDPGDQSALDLIGLTGVNPRTSLDPLPGYDEKWHIVGGNDQLVHGMAAQLPAETLRLGHRLVALRENSDGSYTLTFEVDGTTTDVVADHVALALPFTLLREVDLSRAGFDARKVRVVDTFGMGSNAKIHVEVAEKTWARHGLNGVAYTDWQSFDVCWDDSVPRGRHGAPALLLAFPGASTGRDTLTGGAHGPSPVKDVDWFLDRIDPIFPGTRDAFTGAAYEDHWARDPWVRVRTRSTRSASTRPTVRSPLRPRDGSTSPASTRRSTTRGSSTAPSRRASVPRRRSSPSCSGAQPGCGCPVPARCRAR